jgi:drug/metabolite transporter (DMT)-like permease
MQDVPWSCGCAVIYLPTSWLYVWFYWSKLTDDEKAIPWYKWAIMGTLDSIAGILQSLGVAFVSSGTLVTLLLQAAIPASMIISRVILGKRYKVHNYVGAFAVIVGIIVVLLPKLVSPDPDSGNTPPAPGGLITWALVLLLSCVPMALSSVYKELALGDADCDPWHMNGQVALYQFIVSIVLLYPSAIAEGVPAQDLWQNIGDGFKCLGGTNSLSTDNCGDAPWLVAAYCVANLGYNVLIIVLLKLGGSNLLWLCLTAMVPLASFFFALPFVPAANRSTINVWTGVGLVVILGGLVIYRFWNSLVPLLVKWGLLKAQDDTSAPKVEGEYVALDVKGESSVNSESPSYSTTPIRGGMHIPRRKREGGKR